MKWILTYLFVFGLMSCSVQTANSVSGDKELFSALEIDPSTPQGQRFLAANDIIKSKCSGCHTSFASYSEKQWIVNGYITPKTASTSTLFRKIRGAVSGSGGNMPPSESLSTTQISSIESWINGISQ